MIDTELDSSALGCSVSIDGRYGTGKTWLLRMWEDLLTENEEKVIYLDLWKDELYNDPLISFSDAILNACDQDNAVQKQLNQLIQFISSSAQKTAHNILEKSGISLACGDDYDRLSEYRNFKEHVESVKREIAEKVSRSDKKRIFILVDELDRVRPTYALQSLEIMKHFFSIKGVIFIFALNRKELENSIKHVYGPGLDFEGYYRRFFNLQREIPPIDYSKFSKHIYDKVQEGGISLGFPIDSLNDRLKVVANLMACLDFSLRDTEELYRMLSYFIKTKDKYTWSWNYLDLLFLACVLYLKEKNLFQDLGKILSKRRYVLPEASNDEKAIAEIKDFIKKIIPGYPHKTIAYAMSTLLRTVCQDQISVERRKEIFNSVGFSKYAYMLEGGPITSFHGMKRSLREALARIELGIPMDEKLEEPLIFDDEID